MRKVIVDHFKGKKLEVLVTRDEVSRSYTGSQARRILAVIDQKDADISDKATFVVIPNF